MNEDAEIRQTPAERERLRRQERVAAALRANLLRRKEQARARAAQPPQDDEPETN